MKNYHHFSASSAKRQALSLLCLFLLGTGALLAQPSQLSISSTEMTQIAPTKVYDGTTSAIITTLGTLTGVDATHPNVILNGVANYTDPNVGGIKLVVVTYSLFGPDSIYYLPPVNDTLLGGIDPKQITMYGTTLDTVKIYNQGVLAPIATLGTPYGIITGDTVFVSASAAFDDPYVGTNKNVTITYNLYGNPIQCANYLPPAPATGTSSIVPRTLYAPTVGYQNTKVYDGNTTCSVTDTGTLSGVLPGDIVYHSVSAAYNNPHVGTLRTVSFTFTLHGDQSFNYTIVDTTTAIHFASITPRQLSVTGAIVQTIKTYDGNDTARVIYEGSIANYIEGDDIDITAVATYDSPDVGINKTIILHYSLIGAAVSDYLAPSDEIYTTEGKIILPVVIDTTAGINGIVSGSNHFCPGNTATISCVVTQGTPFYYNIDFDSEAEAQGFVDFNALCNFDTATNSFNMFINLPANCAAGSYSAFVIVGNEANDEVGTPWNFNVNLPNTYLVQVFNDVVSIDNRENRFNTFQWYLNGNPIEGATKPYYSDPRGYLNGDYSVLTNAGTADEQFICPITFNGQPQSKSLLVNPNPVVNTTKISLSGFDNCLHLITVYNSFGTQVLRTTFNGNEFTLDMTNMPYGTYMINVDGETSKTIKL